MARKSREEIRRSEAAARGWKTRRANAEHARRAEAARKGWETRRERAELSRVERAREATAAERRSEAARKGWETRRERAADAARERKAAEFVGGEPVDDFGDWEIEIGIDYHAD